MRRAIPVLATLALALALAGCMPDYNPSSFIEKYRVLGVTVDPPAVTFTPEYQGRVDLALVDAFPMAAAGDEVDPVINGIEWSVCLMSTGAAGGYACTMEEIPLTDVSPDGRTASFDGALVAFGIEMLADSIGQLMDGLRQAVKFTDDCNRAVITDYDACLSGGTAEECNPAAFEGFKACIYANGLTPVFRVRVSVTDMLLDDQDEPVLGDDGKPTVRDRTIEAFKSVSFGPYSDENPANRNPVFSIRRWRGDFDVYDDILHPENLIATTAGAHIGPRVFACPGEKLRFLATVPPESVDKVPAGDGTTVDEYWQLSWYANNGRWKKIRTGSVTAEGKELDLSNVLTFPHDKPVGTTTVTVVMRDEQFGLDWITFTIGAESRDRCLIDSPWGEGGGK